MAAICAHSLGGGPQTFAALAPGEQLNSVENFGLSD
jgi:hypothetical protein